MSKISIDGLMQNYAKAKQNFKEAKAQEIWSEGMRSNDNCNKENEIMKNGTKQVFTVRKKPNDNKVPYLSCNRNPSSRPKMNHATKITKKTPGDGKRKETSDDEENHSLDHSSHCQRTDTDIEIQVGRPKEAVIFDNSELVKIKKTFLTEIRTAGIFRRAQIVIIDLFEKYEELCQQTRQNCNIALRQWTNYADRSITYKNETINCLEYELDEARKSIEMLNENAKLNAISHSDVIRENEELKEKIQKVQNEFKSTKESLEKENKASMNEFILAMEKEIEQIRQQVHTSSKEAAAKYKNRYSHKLGKYKEQMLRQIRSLEEENQTLRINLEQNMERATTEVQGLNALLHSKEQDENNLKIQVQNLSDQLEEAKKSLEQKEQDCRERGIQLINENERLVNEIEAISQKWKNELDTVETRVKSIIAQKDLKLSQANDKARELEEKVHELEAFIKTIDEGFCEVN